MEEKVNGCQKKQGRPAVRIISSGLMIAGTSIGAGILGVPVLAGLAGAAPSILLSMVCWLLMIVTGWILANGLNRRRTSGLDLGSLYRLELGRWGGVLAPIIYLLLFHFLLVAFLTGGGAVLGHLLGRTESKDLFILIFFSVAAGLVVFGPDLVRKCNTLLMLLLAAAFAVLLFECGRGFNPSRLGYQDWFFLPGVLPIIICAFGYHSVIPLTCEQLDYNQRRVGLAMLLGTGMALFFNVTWILAVIGALPLSGPGQANLLAAYHLKQPATVPLALALDSSLMSLAGAIFSLTAITTSYVTVGAALQNFTRDLAGSLGIKPRRIAMAGATLLPSLAISLLWPSLFLTALNLVGGFCLIILLGIMPALMLLVRGERRGLAATLLILFIAILLMDLAQETGWLLINPEWDHWVIKLPGM